MKLSAWLIELAHHYGNAVRITLIDPQSLEGFFKAVRYWVRRYPAFIIAGHKEYVGWDKAIPDRVLQARLSGGSPAGRAKSLALIELGHKRLR